MPLCFLVEGNLNLFLRYFLLMFSDIVEKVKGFLSDPVETFRHLRDDDLSTAIKYYIILLVFYSVISGIIAMFGFHAFSAATSLPAMGIYSIVFFFIAGLLGIFISGIILHIFVYIVGGRRGLDQTLKTVLYASTPGLLLGWIPIIGIFVGIWGLVLEILGIRELHEISTGRAILAVLLPVVVIVILVVLASVTYIFGTASGSMQISK
jgi:hypothetical protein